MTHSHLATAIPSSLSSLGDSQRHERPALEEMLVYGSSQPTDTGRYGFIFFQLKSLSLSDAAQARREWLDIVASRLRRRGVADILYRRIAPVIYRGIPQSWLPQQARTQAQHTRCDCPTRSVQFPISLIAVVVVGCWTMTCKFFDLLDRLEMP